MRATCATYANRGGTYYMIKIQYVKLFVPVCHQEAQNTFFKLSYVYNNLKNLCVYTFPGKTGTHELNI